MLNVSHSVRFDIIDFLNESPCFHLFELWSVLLNPAGQADPCLKSNEGMIPPHQWVISITLPHVTPTITPDDG